jgi:hypothetical protein
LLLLLLALAILVAERGNRGKSGRLRAVLWRGKPFWVGTVRRLEIVVTESTGDVTVVFGITVSVIALTEVCVACFCGGEDIREVGHCGKG